jgi:hypothetical protein
VVENLGRAQADQVRESGNDAAFAMRGFMSGQVNVLYNGINLSLEEFYACKIGGLHRQQGVAARLPSSLMSGEGAVGDAINFGIISGLHAGRAFRGVPDRL